MARLVRDGVALAYEELGTRRPQLLFVHGAACNRRFWAAQIRFFAPRHRVIAVDLRGHGESDAPPQQYTIRAFADDLAWLCAALEIERPAVIGHSLGGLIALEFAGAYPDRAVAVALIDSVLLPSGDRRGTVDALVAGLRSAAGEATLRDYFETFFGPHDDPTRKAWILDQAVRTPAHVTSSVWEESLRSWDDAAALCRCQAPLLYLDAGTPNADLARATELRPELLIGRTIGSGHFSPLEVAGQVNAMLDRFLTLTWSG